MKKEKAISPIVEDDSCLYWECLRRRSDYRQSYRKLQELTEIYQISIKRKGRKHLYTKTFLNEISSYSLKEALRWRAPLLNPDIPFTKLARPDKEKLSKPWLLLIGLPTITIPPEEIDSALRNKLQTIPLVFKHGMLPSRFSLQILPVRPDPDRITQKGSPPRRRADRRQFQAEMLAWDMHKAGKSFSVIGIKLETLGVPISSHNMTRQRNLIGTANNYCTAAQKKIDRCLDWRGVTN